MKKIILVFSFLLLVCGCGNSSNSLIDSDYINTHDYNQIYSDLSSIVEEVSFIPSEDNEKEFYELIEVISDNCTKFTNNELNELYNLMNSNYQFIYSGDRYNNDNYNSDLNTIKSCITE